VLLKADRQPGDPFAVAEALAAELGAGGYDVIFFGKKSIDADNSATGAMVGELLGLPVVTGVSKLEIAGGKGTAHRSVEGGYEVLEFPLPAIVTVDEGLNKERLPSLKGIMAAKKKPLDTKPAQLGGAGVTVKKMELPPERAAGRIVGEGAAAVPELVRLLQSEAKVL
jgi:electron transfer flavoprotein beta subunit